MLKNLNTRTKLFLFPIMFIIIVFVSAFVYKSSINYIEDRIKVSGQTYLLVDKLLVTRVSFYQFLQNPSQDSKKAIEINIAIMRNFVVLRNSILSLEEITNRVSEIEQQFPEIYKALNYQMDTNQKNIEQKERSKIGFKKK